MLTLYRSQKPLARRGASTIRFLSATGEQEPRWNGRLDHSGMCASIKGGRGPHDSPHISDRPQYLREQRLLLQHGTEAFHQWAQPALRHGGDQVVKHAALTEQGMR